MVKQKKEQPMSISETNGHKPLVVTTLHKGVFFGYGVPGDGLTIRIEKARMCSYWSADMKGMPGLASIGPSKNCKVGLAVPAITLRDVTGVFECTPEAAEKWEQGPWA